MTKQEIQLPAPTSTVMGDHTRKTAQSAQDNLTLPYVPEDGGPASLKRQSPLFLGYLCDMRRAVIAINIIGFIYGFSQVVLAGIGLAFVDDIVADALANDMETTQDNILVGELTTKVVFCLSLVTGLLSILFCSLGIYGAIKFNLCLVGTATAYRAADFAISLLAAVFDFEALYVIHLILGAVFLYAHIALMKSMRRGTMSEDNYATERRTCCGC